MSFADVLAVAAQAREENEGHVFPGVLERGEHLRKAISAWG